MPLLESVSPDSSSCHEELLAEGMPLVKKIAFSLARRLPASVEVGDLMQAGYLGLLTATRKFDPEQRVRFTTYASLRIRGAMLDSLRDVDWVPRAIRKRQREWRKAAARLAMKLGRIADEKELAQEIGLTQQQLKTSRHAGSDGFILTRADADGLGSIPSRDESPQDRLERKEIRELLARAIESLPSRERLVVTLYYYEELAMKKIGCVIGVNESRVSQLHSKALRTLSLRIRQHLRPEPLPLPGVKAISLQRSIA
jgi:RNA polymerase sigma factor for flagellar operon FliA